MMRKHTVAFLIGLTVVVTISLSLGSCGKRGAPKPIGSQEIILPKKYPTH